MSSINLNQRPRVALQAFIDGKTQQVEIPQYSLRFPNLNRVSLAAVKSGIFRPDLPSIQRNFSENNLSKFPIENSKTSTNLNHEKFDVNHLDNKYSYPIRLVGDVEESAKHFFRPTEQHIISPETVMNAKTSCVSGRENLPYNVTDSNEGKQLKSQFRFNRVRSIPVDQPADGRMPSHLSTLPGFDKIGRRVESCTAKNEGFQYTNLKISEPFQPYGNTSSHYNNYIMNYPRF